MRVSRVVPSQVVELIDKLYPNAKDEVEGKATVTLNADHSIQLMSIVELTEQIPSELIRLSSSQYAEYISGIAAIRWTVQRWQQVDKPGYTKIPPFIRGLRQYSPVALIRQALAVCPDESSSIGITELN